MERRKKLRRPPPSPTPHTGFPEHTRRLRASLYKNECGRGRDFGPLWGAPCLSLWGGSYWTAFPLGVWWLDILANSAWGVGPVAEKKVEEARMRLRIDLK